MKPLRSLSAAVRLDCSPPAAPQKPLRPASKLIGKQRGILHPRLPQQPHPQEPSPPPPPDALRRRVLGPGGPGLNSTPSHGGVVLPGRESPLPPGRGPPPPPLPSPRPMVMAGRSATAAPARPGVRRKGDNRVGAGGWVGASERRNRRDQYACRTQRFSYPENSR